METHADFDVNHAFVAGAEDITKIWCQIESAGMEPQLAASCSDGLIRHFDKLDAFLNYSNPDRAAIISIKLSGRSIDPYMSASISLGAKYSSPVSVSICGDEQTVSKIRQEISDVLSGMRPWYSWLATLDQFWIWTPLFSFVFLVLGLMSGNKKSSNSLGFFDALTASLFGLSVVLGIIFFIWLCFLAQKKIFPVATFAIGQKRNNHHILEKMRWAVIVGFLVSFSASVAYGAISLF